MSRMPWILGGGALAAYLWSRGGSPDSRSPNAPHAMATPPDVIAGRWVWPVPAWQGRSPVISDGFGTRRSTRRHGGVDVMFRRVAGDAFAVGSVNGSKGHVMPDDVPALAASDGVVWSAMQTPRGYAVVLDHGQRGALRVATFYTHLSRLLVSTTARAASKERVRAGQPLGVIGFDPLDPQKLKHLHFELWLGGPSDRVDPASMMRRWEIVGASEPLLARNARLTYRPVGARGEPYLQGVRDLKGRAGVYLIRDAETRELLYIGSSSGRLYDTLTRHFQTWRRFKGFWRDQYGEGHDPGLTYDRARFEVAVRLTSPEQSLDEEARLIWRMSPRDNLLGQAAEEEVPF